MNHPAFHEFFLAQETNHIEQVARRPRPTRREPAALAAPEVILRLCTVHDDEALDRLAELEGKPLPRGRFVVALVDGALIAAQPLDGSEPFTDPFRATEQILPLMDLRVRQLTDGNGRRRRLPLPGWSAARL
jgi:hypothetical protein